jgi:hypothetical protein
MSDPLPVDVVEAAVQAAGAAFHFKKPLQLLMRRAGVPDTMWHRYEQLSKYQIARNIFGDLEAKGPAGNAIQQRIVQQLISLRSFPREVDAATAARAVQSLRELSRSELLESEIEKRDRERRLGSNTQRQINALYRATQLVKLKASFQTLVVSQDRQRRGFELELPFKDLFRLFDLEYKQSYRTETEQVDGAFKDGLINRGNRRILRDFVEIR